MTQDEHYEAHRPFVIATLIPQTTTSEMNFYAYSDFDNVTRRHYTLAPRMDGVNQLYGGLCTLSRSLFLAAPLPI